MRREILTVALGALMSLPTFASSTPQADITVDEVVAAQNSWGRGIVQIGSVFTARGDYRSAAATHIRDHYDYEKGTVLFKPTLASAHPFRPTFDEALSYFVGGMYAEDSGFAIKPWTNVRFENHGIVTYGTKAVAMGHYYFTNTAGDETKVEYTLGFKKRGNDVKIFLQDSSLPFTPAP